MYKTIYVPTLPLPLFIESWPYTMSHIVYVQGLTMIFGEPTTLSIQIGICLKLFFVVFHGESAIKSVHKYRFHNANDGQ